MPETAAWYRIELVRGRPHRLHEKVAPLLVRLSLPDAGFRQKSVLDTRKASTLRLPPPSRAKPLAISR
jgi:hypothetical protein